MLKQVSHVVAYILILTQVLFPQTRQPLGKSTVDDNSKFTSAGNIAITISNYGVVGHGFRLWPQQPSMQYPRGSGIEHMFVGGIWFGALAPAGIHVTTAAVDVGSLRSVAAGFEFTTSIESRVLERSSLADNRFYDPQAISHQDLIADFTDINTTNPNQNNEVIPNHFPLGINVHLEAYAWNFSFADNFVIMNYWIKNVSGGSLDSVYVSFWADLVVRNTNVTPPTVGAPFYNKGGLGYVDTLKLAYAYDYNGDGGLADTYGAMMFLGSTPYKNKTTYQSWQFGNSSDPVYFSPSTDNDKFSKMATGLTQQQITGITKPSNNMTMITMGPISHIGAGDSVNVVFALLAAKKKSSNPPDDDSPAQKVNLFQAAQWAQRTYNGEDRNGNGIQDSNEVWTDNGKPKRFFLPAPPNVPKLKIIPSDKLVEIYWDRSSEASVDPISNKKDFEGYRVYGTNAGIDLAGSQDLLSNLNLLGEFDRADDKIGYNTGFGYVKLPTPVQFLPDTTTYYYKFSVPGLLNGWQYAFSVTAFDSGDASTGLQSLESSRLYALRRVIPGSTVNSNFAKQVGVYPNPYYAKAFWDGTGERDRKLYFFNLPARAEVRVYTLAGDLVHEFTHESSSYNGSDIRWFKKLSDGTQVMAGGDHAWDLISQRDQAIATGLYLFTVKNTDTGDIQRGKFLIIK
jgi:hypothetical protein